VAFGMIGASLSGVTFISVPGWVVNNNMIYLQMVFGYFLGYLFIAYVLLPMYYKLNLISIYTYLKIRFGKYSYKTGSVFFLISRLIGASFRLYLVANVLHSFVFAQYNIPYFVTIIVTICFIWLYTFKAGIKTIVWTDCIQTLFMLIALVASIVMIYKQMPVSDTGFLSQIYSSSHFKIFEFNDWTGGKHFVQQFFSGAFITIVMTGLDQDMMQKNLSCKSYKEAKKNMLYYGFGFIPVNILFLVLGILLINFSNQNGISIPELTDNLYPNLAINHLGTTVAVFFILGLFASAYSSADSALTSLTTSFMLDILSIPESETRTKTRIRVHLLFSGIIILIVLIFSFINNKAVISQIFKVAGYTYGPLLGLYFTGMFTKIDLKDKYVPIVAFISPIIAYLLSYYCYLFFNYKVGFELLIYNGLICFIGLILLRKKKEIK
jgi:Na+/proline symporter